MMTLFLGLVEAVGTVSPDADGKCERFTLNNLVEAVGIEPTSKNEDFKETTCLVSALISDGKSPTDGLFLIPAYKVSPHRIDIRCDYPTILTPYRT